MADIGKILGSIIGGAASPEGGIVDAAKGIIGMFKMDPTVKAQLEQQLTLANLDLEKTELAGELASIQGQLEINKQEAASTNWFVAGWRPAVGWVCVLALLWAYLLEPFLEFGFASFHKSVSNLPHLDTGTLISGLLIPLLGIATLRTVEKVTGTEGNR